MKKKKYRIKVPCDGHLIFVDKIFQKRIEAINWARWNYKGIGEWYLVSL